MRIGIAGPINLQTLNIDANGQNLPSDYTFPMYSLFINSLIDRGYEVIAFTVSKEISKPLIVKSGKLTLCIAPRKPHAGRRLFKSEIESLTKLMVEQKPDIIHALWSYEFAWAALNSKLPNVITLQDHATTILKFQFDFFRIARWLMNFYVLRNCHHLIANSQYLYDLLSKRNKNNARIIPNFYPNYLEEYFPKSNNKDNYILTISSGFGERKNLSNAILAFSNLRRKFKDLEYHIIGNQMQEGGPAYEFAKKNNALEGIVFMGRRPFNDVLEEITKAKVVLHPSREESFGMAVLEPLVIGTPVVGGDKSGNVPYLLNNGTGVTCNINDSKSISTAIEDLLSDKKKSKDIREKASNFARSNFNEDKIIKEHLEYYEFIIADTK